jgi:hypothetical protein
MAVRGARQPVPSPTDPDQRGWRVNVCTGITFTDTFLCTITRAGCESCPLPCALSGTRLRRAEGPRPCTHPHLHGGVSFHGPNSSYTLSSTLFLTPPLHFTNLPSLLCVPPAHFSPPKLQSLPLTTRHHVKSPSRPLNSHRFRQRRRRPVSSFSHTTLFHL